MATATLVPFSAYILNTLKGDIDHDTAVFKCMLLATAATPNADTHDFLDDLVANEVTGTNWAATGQTVTATLTQDAASDQVRIEFSDISVATVTLTDAKHFLIYNSSPATNATRHLVAYGTFDTALAPTAGTLAITFPAPSLYFDYT
jgi:hypothetical protein